MKITNKVPESKPVRLLSTCHSDEAFKYQGAWYTMIQSNFDPVIESVDDCVEEFVEGHVHCNSVHFNLIPCIELNTMTLVFLADDAIKEWAEVEAILTARS
jgi:hypothetical protein